MVFYSGRETKIDTEGAASNFLSFFNSSSPTLSPGHSLSFPLPHPPPRLISHLAGHFHGLGDRSDSLGAVRVGAGARAGPIHGARTCQGGCSGASQSCHAGRRHWEAEKGSVMFVTDILDK